MFDFLFKRKTSKPVIDAGPSSVSSATPVSPVSPGNAAIPAGHAKQSAMTQAEALQGEEAAVEFILQSQFADARLKAAEQVHSRPALERVFKGVRDTDRRVARLMQSRLDIIAKRQSTAQHAQQCIDEANRLLVQAQLMPNQVADLDRAWPTNGETPVELRDAFDTARAALRLRLEAQTALQRAVLNTLAKLKALMNDAADLDPTDIGLALSTLESEMAAHRASPEALSVPPQLATQFDEHHTALRQSLSLLLLRFQALQIRRQKLDEWESATDESLDREILRREWQALPALQDDETSIALQARFQATLARVIVAAKPVAEKVVKPSREAGKEFSETLDAMEKALEEGAVRIASMHDKTLRDLDIKSARLTDAQGAQLARARSELGRLQAWAKWGGTVSREELLKAAEGMAGMETPPAELAKKVGSLRERWKSLDSSAGSAPRELWERFDAACTVAYAPAAEHFKKLADERQQNQLAAQAMISEVVEFTTISHVTAHANGAEDAAVDWKGVAQFTLRAAQSWQRLGPIDRKYKKKLDADFAQAMQVLLTPLTDARRAEIARREQLIDEAANLRATDRSAPELLRALQERWQLQSKSLPLERRDEQALWQRFRSACDAVFARRKEAAVTADAGRRENLEAKEVLCAALEATIDSEEALIAKTLQQTRAAWIALGPAPHAAQAAIDARYQTAVGALQAKLDSLRQSTLDKIACAMHERIALCRQAEQMLLARVQNNAEVDDAQLQQLILQWQAIPALPSPFAQAMQKRLDAAMTALKSNDSGYAATLAGNVPTFMTDILRFEILAGIESPAALSRERMKLQVDVLQSALKAGVKPVPQKTQLCQICALPVVTDADTAARLDKLIDVVKDALGQ